MTLRLIRGARSEAPGRSSRTNVAGQFLADHRGHTLGAGLTDDPAARRRELAVVFELCCARERGLEVMPREADRAQSAKRERRKMFTND